MPFICEKCNHSFDSNTKLKNHLNKKVSCVIEPDLLNPLKCTFCDKLFSTKYNLQRHDPICIVRNNPEILVQQIEKQKKFMGEILAQKDDIIDQQKKLLSQQAETIEHMKELKPDTHIEGDHNTVDNSVKNIKNIDKSTNITNNITLIEQPLALRSADMLYLLRHQEKDNESEFWVLARNIRESMKRGDVDGMINSLLTYIHNNKKLKEGQNLRYCPDGKHKGELLIYDYDENGIGFWRPSDVRPISLVLSAEFKHINKIQDEKDEKNKDDRTAKERNTKKEEYNIGQLGFKSEHIHESLSVQEAVIKFIKQFRISKIVPENIRDNLLDDDHPLNDKISRGVTRHKKQAKSNEDKIDVIKSVKREGGSISGHESPSESSDIVVTKDEFVESDSEQ